MALSSDSKTLYCVNNIDYTSTISKLSFALTYLEKPGAGSSAPSAGTSRGNTGGSTQSPAAIASSKAVRSGQGASGAASAASGAGFASSSVISSAAATDSGAASDASAEGKSSSGRRGAVWMWIIGALLVALLAGEGVFLVLQMKKKKSL